MAREMTPRERILTALRGDVPDRVPVALRMSTFLNDIYGGGGRLAQLKAAKEFGTDVVMWEQLAPLYVWTQHASYWDLPQVVVETMVRQGKHRLTTERTFHTPAGVLHDVVERPCPGYVPGHVQSPMIVEPLIKDHADLEALPFLFAPPSSLRLTHMATLREIVGDHGFVEPTLHGPVDVQAAELLHPNQRFLTLYYDDRELMRRVLRICQDAIMGYIQGIMEAGEKIIFIWWAYASQSYGWSPAIWREMFYPLIQEQVELVHACGALYHYYDDGPVRNILGYLRELRIDALSTLTPPPMGDTTMSEYRRAIGGQAALMGGLDMIHGLMEGTPESVDAAVRQLIADGGPGGGYVLDVTNTIRTGTPVDNVKAAVKAARRYGRYDKMGHLPSALGGGR
ncbi:MAG: hypothetical protein HPY83_19390 [Anaerolineae bacterium]|nr:hypothetical protein [Anaerolineae bacterium]